MNENYRDMAPWFCLRTKAWPEVVAVLDAGGRRWSAGAVRTDLRWWQDQERLGLRERPGRPKLAQTWRWTDWQSKQMLKDEPAWGDPHKVEAAADIERQQARDGSGWIRGEIDAWAEVADDLTALGRAWPDVVIEADLAWWSDRYRRGLVSEPIGRVEAVRRWSCSEWRAKQALKAAHAAGLFFLPSAPPAHLPPTSHAPPAQGADTSRTPPAGTGLEADNRDDSTSFHQRRETDRQVKTRIRQKTAPRADLRREADRIVHSPTPPTPSTGSGGHVHGGVRREHGRQQRRGGPHAVPREALGALRQAIREGINRLSGEEGRRNAVPTPPAPLRATWSARCWTCDFTADPSDPAWNVDWPGWYSVPAWRDRLGPPCPACAATGDAGRLVLDPPERTVDWAICHAAGGGCGTVFDPEHPAWNWLWTCDPANGGRHGCPICEGEGRLTSLETFWPVRSPDASGAAETDASPASGLVLSKLRRRDRRLVDWLRRSTADVWAGSRRRSLFLSVMDEVLDELEGTGRPRGDPAEIDAPD